MSNVMELLSMDLSSVDVSRPVAIAGPTVFVLREATIEPVKDDPNTQQLVCQFDNKFALKDSKDPGVSHEPGKIKVTSRLILGEKGKWTVDSTKQELKKMLISCKSPDASFGDPSKYIGRDFDVRLGIELDDTGKYDPKNSIRFIKG